MLTIEAVHTAFKWLAIYTHRTLCSQQAKPPLHPSSSLREASYSLDLKSQVQEEEDGSSILLLAMLFEHLSTISTHKNPSQCT